MGISPSVLQLIRFAAVVGTLTTLATTQTLQPLLDNSSYSGNPRLCGPPLNSCNSTSHNSSPIPLPIKDQESNNLSPIPSLMQDQDSNNVQKNSSDKNQTNTLLLIFSVVLLLAIILLLILYYNTARKLNKMVKVVQVPIEEEKDVVISSAEKKIEIREGTKMTVEERKELIFFKEKPRFQMGQLLRASAEALGQGTIGNSYKAMLHDGPNIVVKRVRDLKPLSQREFAMQLRMIADLQHPNLLPLLAYYHSRDEKLLLYRYAENGNLFSRLHDGRGGNRVPLKWNSRLSIAQGVAQALEYLHNNTKSPTTIVPHGNLKTSNVLLDENDAVLVSDYGLSSLIAQPIAVQRMVVYKSPEYGYARKVTVQSDVWSYGCLLVELLTGKISACSAPQGSCGGVDLCSWVHRAVREEWTAEIFDKEIYRQKNAHEGMLRLFQIAMRCIERFPENRPGMSQVVREVEKIQAVPVKISELDHEDELLVDRSLTTDDSFSTTTSTSGIIAD